MFCCKKLMKMVFISREKCLKILGTIKEFLPAPPRQLLTQRPFVMSAGNSKANSCCEAVTFKKKKHSSTSGFSQKKKKTTVRWFNTNVMVFPFFVWKIIVFPLTFFVYLFSVFHLNCRFKSQQN